MPAQAAVAGTSVIAGQVVTDEQSPRPVRRAVVDCAGTDTPTTHSVVTDDEGRFSCANLPAGRFLVSAHKAAFVTTAYGASRPGRPGTPVAVARDARVDLTIRLVAGSVLTGTVRESDGAPLSGARISVINSRSGDRNAPQLPTAAMTDDNGAYRVYGLVPGEYVIVAQPRVTGSGPIGAPSEAEMDAMLARIAARAQSNPPDRPAAPRTPPLIPTASGVGFMSTYYPGTSNAKDAVAVKVAAGEERGGLDFTVAPVRTAAIEGTVSGPIPNLAVTQVSILPAAEGWFGSIDSNPIMNLRPTATESTFRFVNVAPGHYTITARADRQKTSPDPVLAGVSASFGPAGAVGGGASGDYLYAVAEVDVNGADVPGIELALQPAAVVFGKLTFDSVSGPPAALTGVRVALALSRPSFNMNMGATLIGTQLNNGASASVEADGTFSIKGVGPGRYIVNVQLPPELSKTWSLKSAISENRDALDVPLEVAAGAGAPNLVVTLSDRHAELSGSLQTPAGAAASDYFVIVFPSDRALWRPGARRARSTRPASDGRFSLADLPPGEYFLAALADLEPADLGDAPFLEQVVPAALKITIADGEKKTQDLRIAK